MRERFAGRRFQEANRLFNIDKFSAVLAPQNKNTRHAHIKKKLQLLKGSDNKSAGGQNGKERDQCGAAEHQNMAQKANTEKNEENPLNSLYSVRLID